jgi:uncharacterized protein (DUF1778 family)
LAEAAAWRGLSVNSFILQAASKEADLILEQERVLRITADDAAMLLGLLDNPPKPNAALTRAFGRRKETSVLFFEPLSRSHDRQHLDCGNDALNTFLRQTARQHQDKGNLSDICPRRTKRPPTDSDSRVLHPGCR